MIIALSGYPGGYRVLSLAKCLDSLSELRSRDLDILYLDCADAVIYPEKKRFPLSPSDREELNDCCDFDVFEIDDRGFAYKYFDVSSNDNAILVTNTCNSNCIMCPTPERIRRKPSFITADSLINIVSHFPRDAVHVTITGGEPFLIKKELFKLLSYLKEEFRSTDFRLLTNGRAFAIDGYAELYASSEPRELILGIPIHGHDAALHDSITQSPGSFAQTMTGLKKVLALGAKVELRIVVSKLNADHIGDVGELIARELPTVSHVRIMAMEMTGNAAKNKDAVWIDYDKAFECSKGAIDTLVRAGIDVALYNFPLCTVSVEYWNICQKSISVNKIRFAPQCEECSVKDACGGVFSGTIRLLKDKLSPILKR